MVASGVGLVAAGGPDLSRLPDYVVDVAAGGKLSGTGKVSSSPAQIAALVSKMGADHDDWVANETDQTRHVVLYAHGGLVGEDGGIATADRMIDWWRKNGIYPVHIVWESDALTTIFGFIEHKLREVLPFGAPFDGLIEQIDRKLEGVGHGVRPLWEEMKANARAASAPLSGAAIDWTSHEPGEEPGRLAVHRAPADLRDGPSRARSRSTSSATAPARSSSPRSWSGSSRRGSRWSRSS